MTAEWVTQKSEGAVGVCLMSRRKLNMPLLIALIAAGAQILVAVIQAISRWYGGS